MARTILGVIGGSGIYDIPGLENPHWKRIKSPWGEPSDALPAPQGSRSRLLPRHGH
jgi:5'-methylthioadenosine phosphorylase